ncbi:MAG: undecaprenyldiphospho-muramoylpentapeptide beta-N-acetylglucosaminyltransferase [Coriobacteriia bacterium]|nr:undecaprenyldiphospho-muramoylpentapeptide beta-N-acetylglucosaminyltransferase [Coriobacteriia bacterium]MBS5477338.1 undecaprenyldiphospho-muramoylpentapeptide beta-N-acetylglucosaminyltransferase [Coriobacteriia bacterium]
MSIVAIAAGGTAGHINPALALAEELRDRGHDVRFLGTPGRLESRLVPEQGFAFEGLDVAGFDRSRPWTLFTAALKVSRATKRLTSEFSGESRPAVAVGFGAYVEVPLGRAAAKLGIPLVLHEQNSVPGLANKMLARTADTLALTYPAARPAFEGKTGPQTRVIETGNPVRRLVLAPTRADARARMGLPDDATVLLVFGGSLGALHINEAIASLKDELLSRENLYVLHGTGKRDYAMEVEKLALTPEQAKRWRVMEYIDDMGSMLAASDVVLSRAGASSIAEIAARHVPALLVPYPFATGNHQAVNARLLVDAGGAELLDDAQLDDAVFPQTLLGLVDDAARRAAMRAGLEGLGAHEAAGRLADAVEAAMGRGAGASR